METKKTNKNNQNVDDQWILCTSKNKAGRKYLFNTATGESKWCTKEAAATDRISNEKAPATRKIRQPAQDRLKRLQKEIRVKKPIITKPEKKTSHTPAIAENSLLVHKTDPKNLNKPVELKEDEESSHRRKRKITSTVVQQLQPVPDFIYEVAEKKVKHDKSQSTFKNVLNNVKKKIVKKSITKSQKLNNVKKLNDLKKDLLPTFPVLAKFTIPKVVKTENPIDSIVIPKVEDTNNIIVFTELPKTPTPAAVVDVQIKQTIIPTTVRKGIGKNLKSIQFNRDSNIQFKANQRLEQLREKLKSQLKETNSIVEQKISVDKSNNNNEEEPMDWESGELVVDNKIEERSFNGYYSKKTINNSLLYFANEQRAKSKQKWHKDYYYIVPDTNVWLYHLTFLDELSKMKLLTTEGSILYIPYIVIKELDGLKNRESCEMRAKMAINYIHEQLKTNNIHLQTQSASAEREHLIDVDSPDDSIINCCLQVQRQVNHIMLLSEDTNLRNKAKCNDVFTTTKSDLLSFH